MAERPLLATDRVALAIREGRQTQDRRPVRGVFRHPLHGDHDCIKDWDGLPTRLDLFAQMDDAPDLAPWQPGDLLYVREAHQIESGLSGASREHCFWAYVTYRADGERLYFEPDMEGWSMSLDFHRVTPVRPNIHMPKWAARTWVRVKRVWVEWKRNEWVWCCEFEREEQGR